MPELAEQVLRLSAIDVSRELADYMKKHYDINKKDFLKKKAIIRATLKPEQIIPKNEQISQNKRRAPHQVKAYTRRTKSGGTTKVRSHIRRGRVNFTLPRKLTTKDNEGFWVGLPNKLRGKNKKLEPVFVDLRPAFPIKNFLIEPDKYREILERNFKKVVDYIK